MRNGKNPKIYDPMDHRYSGQLVKRIQDALGTAEYGDNLVEVASNAHRAEMQMASQSEFGKIADRKSYYVMNAIAHYVRDTEEKIKEARKTLEFEHNDKSMIYKSLENMANHLEWVAKEYKEVEGALKVHYKSY